MWLASSSLPHLWHVAVSKTVVLLLLVVGLSGCGGGSESKTSDEVTFTGSVILENTLYQPGSFGIPEVKARHLFTAPVPGGTQFSCAGINQWSVVHSGQTFTISDKLQGEPDAAPLGTITLGEGETGITQWQCVFPFSTTLPTAKRYYIWGLSLDDHGTRNCDLLASSPNLVKCSPLFRWPVT